MEVKRGSSSAEDAGVKATIARQEKELAELRAKLAAKDAASIRVSKSGGVSVYGLGRFPVTLYGSQWTKLLGMHDDILSFIEEHHDELSWKEEA